MKFGLHILNIYGYLYVEMVSWQRLQRVKKLFQIWLNTKYTVENWGTMSYKWMPTRFPNTYKAIYSINELINDLIT